jgi:arginyl-tRNA synthetase
MVMKERIQQLAAEALRNVYGAEIDPASLTVQPTDPQHEGDLTVLLFPLLKLKLGSPDQIGASIGDALVNAEIGVGSYRVLKGFLNLSISDKHWRGELERIIDDPESLRPNVGQGERVMVEFSSPNTNKPLHLGHLRNNFLGDSISRILAFAGFEVVKANLVNDRGVHICKSMLAWQRFGGQSPEQEGLKGDHLVGKYYVRFEQELKKEAAALMAENSALDEEAARKQAPLQQAVQQMLVAWEANDPEVRALWATMNGWVYAGFEGTYKRMGIAFDHVYRESETYLLGKDVVDEGLAKGVFYRRPDGAVCIVLSDIGLDEKVVLRADGTSVYITQDLGTADLKYRDHAMTRSIYVVGNEQDYHFKVLFAIMARLGRPYAAGLYHLSYGMVELPSGKMKSREGTVVDADDLMAEVVRAAEAETTERGKVEGLSEDERAALYETLGIGALKFYLLRVGAAKKMLFDPAESVSLQGDTGPFVQYTHARIRSLLAKAGDSTTTRSAQTEALHPLERAVIRRLGQLPEAVAQAVRSYEPSAIASYALDLAKDYNRFYAELPVLRAEADSEKALRVELSRAVADALQSALGMLGITAPERM